MTNDNVTYRVVEEGGTKKVERVVSPLYDTYQQPTDVMTMILLAPFYVLGAIILLPVFAASSLMQSFQGGFLAPRQPKMLITEIVRDENGRIVEVIERIV